ncbi:MAG: ATP-dependent Clp protease adaptor ClpS [Gemmatimonadetes bacterium]|nr:MAG: ATP-dependent Clp protease adaptor ClpS [Gemmatimonadota bacterium]
MPTTIEPIEITQPKIEPRRPDLSQIPPYHVVLLDDDDHTYEYVIVMLMDIFGHSAELAYLMACEVDDTGRVIVDTTTKERAELKRDQIHAYGPDPWIPRCKGSMSAIIEPAYGGGEE